MYLLQAIDRFRKEFPTSGYCAPDAASHMPEELNLRTFEIGVISYRPDPAQFRTIAVYNDSLALWSVRHPLARADGSQSTTWGRRISSPTMSPRRSGRK